MKSLPVSFYVQRDRPRSTMGKLPFDLTILNNGGGMDAGSGIFTAPRNGTYSFAFSGLVVHPTSSSVSLLRFALMLNDSKVGYILDQTQGEVTFHTVSLSSVLELKVGDRVWINLVESYSGAYLYDSNEQYTHFTGHLLQEDVASSLGL